MFHLMIKEVLDESDLELKFAKFSEIYSKFQSGEFDFSLNSKENLVQNSTQNSNQNFTQNSQNPAEISTQNQTKISPKILSNNHENSQTKNSSPLPLTTPSYAKICKILPPKDIPKEKDKTLKLASFLHSIAHIEYSAIDLGLDDCYRFRGLPREFYADFLELTNDEFRHFFMIEDELLKLGFKYGDFAVHDGLFFMMKNTQNSLLERMALLHRHSEAVGLDANFFMMKKVKNDKNRAFLIPFLKTIHSEEISHVKKGDKWFRWELERLGLDESCFFKIIKKHLPKIENFRRELDENSRLKGGYSQDEIEKLKEMSS